MVSRMFNTISGKRIAIFGFAFKKDTGDTRETPSAYVCKNLLEERAKLAVYDPKVTREHMFEEFYYTLNLPKNQIENLIETSSSSIEAATGAHAIAILTEWDEFKELDFLKIYNVMVKPAFIFDGRGVVDNLKLRKIGFEVYCIGKPNNII